MAGNKRSNVALSLTAWKDKIECAPPVQNSFLWISMLVETERLTVHRSLVPSSSAFKHLDFVLVCQQQSHIIFVVSVVDSCVSESSS